MASLSVGGGPPAPDLVQSRPWSGRPGLGPRVSLARVRVSVPSPGASIRSSSSGVWPRHSHSQHCDSDPSPPPSPSPQPTGPQEAGAPWQPDDPPTPVCAACHLTLVPIDHLDTSCFTQLSTCETGENRVLCVRLRTGLHESVEPWEHGGQARGVPDSWVPRPSSGCAPPRPCSQGSWEETVRPAPAFQGSASRLAHPRLGISPPRTPRPPHSTHGGPPRRGPPGTCQGPPPCPTTHKHQPHHPR